MNTNTVEASHAPSHVNEWMMKRILENPRAEHLHPMIRAMQDSQGVFTYILEQLTNAYGNREHIVYFNLSHEDGTWRAVETDFYQFLPLPEEATSVVIGVYQGRIVQLGYKTRGKDQTH